MDKLNINNIITIFENGSFLTNYIIKELVATRARINIVSSNFDPYNDWRVYGSVGQITAQSGDFNQIQLVEKYIRNSNFIINLIDVTSAKLPIKLYSQLVKDIAKLCAQYKIKRLIQFCTNNQNNQSNCLSKKIESIYEAKQLYNQAIIFKHGLIYSHDDNFISAIVKMADLFALLPVLSSDEIKYNLVYAQDIAQAIACNFQDQNLGLTQTFNLTTNNSYNIRTIYNYILKAAHKQAWKVKMPYLLAKVESYLLYFLSGYNFSLKYISQFGQLETNLTTDSAFQKYNIEPKNFEMELDMFMR